MNQELRIKEIKIRKLLTNAFVSIFLASCFLIFTSPINAQTLPQQSLRVSPVINDLHLIPGKQTTFQLTIQNISQKPLGIHAEVTGFDITGDAQTADQKLSPLVGWTKLSTNDIVLGENSKKTITVTISPPHNAEQNGYYETIFLTPISQQEQVSWTPVILSRIGVLVLGTIGNLDYNNLAKKVSVSNITLSQTILNTFPADISFSIANTYFTHFDAKPFVTITPLFGNPRTTLLTDKHVLPGSIRIWHYQPTVPTHDIFYQMHLAISIGNGKQITADTWFVVLPYKPILLIVSGALLLFLLIFKRRRLKKFIVILMKG